VRDLLIEDPAKFPFEKFSEVYSQTVTVNWPFDTADVVVKIGALDADVILNPLFEKHIRKISNWTVSPSFGRHFPEAAVLLQPHE
jgi:hypothetical protein